MSREFEILLFEDNETDVFLVRLGLESAGVRFHLEVCSDGNEGLSRIRDCVEGRASCPDLLLLDLNLPKKSGAQVLEHMRQSRRCRDVPVVILSSSDSPKDREQTAQLGATAYFRKPSRLDDFMRLGEIVRQLLASPARPA